MTVPNSDGQKGIDVAAILGIVGGDASRELEVLESVKPEDVEKTRELAAAGYCTCTLQEDVANLYIVAKVCKGSHYAEVTIINRHTYITKIVKDDAILFEAAVSEEFSNYAKLRNGVETVPANIRKNYRLDKLPRGKQRGKFFFGSKIAALNFRKLFGFRKGLVNYAQNPIFG